MRAYKCGEGILCNETNESLHVSIILKKIGCSSVRKSPILSPRSSAGLHFPQLAHKHWNCRNALQRGTVYSGLPPGGFIGKQWSWKKKLLGRKSVSVFFEEVRIYVPLVHLIKQKCPSICSHDQPRIAPHADRYQAQATRGSKSESRMVGQSWEYRNRRSLLALVTHTTLLIPLLNGCCSRRSSRVC